MIRGVFNTMEGEWEREQKKEQLWAISYFWIEVFFKEVLGPLAQPFKLSRDCM